MGSSTDSGIVDPLQSSGLVDAQSLERAITYARDRQGGLSDALLRLEVVQEEAFLKVFSRLYSIPFVKAAGLKGLRLEAGVLKRVSVRDAERLQMCPLHVDDAQGSIDIVAAVPLATSLQTEVARLTGAREVNVSIATAGAVAALVRRSYHGQADAFAQVSSNGAGPVMPSAADEPSIKLGAPSRTENKTVMVKLDEVTNIDTLRRENARYRLTQEFHRRVTLERSVDAMVDRILEVIFDLLPADGAAIWLTSGEYASRSRDGQSPLEVPKSIIESTLNAHSGVITNNALVDGRFGGAESVMLRGIKSAMAVALRTRNGNLGVLYVESISQEAAFSNEDLPLLDSIGSQAAIMLDNVQLLARVEQEVTHRTNLSRFLSAAAVEEVLSGRLNLNMDGQIADVTVLFADLRGFTSLSAQMQPPEVVRFLNAFFSSAVQIIERLHGVVDKFIGDCVMATWGAPVTRNDDARYAIEAALEIVDRCRRIPVGDGTLELGVGIHSGPAVVGAIGSKRRSDYTAIGATVNLAARLCGVAASNEVLITSDTLLRAGPGVVTSAKAPVVFKGLEVPMVPYTVRSVAKPILLSTAAQRSAKPNS